MGLSQMTFDYFHYGASELLQIIRINAMTTFPHRNGDVESDPPNYEILLVTKPVIHGAVTAAAERLSLMTLERSLAVESIYVNHSKCVLPSSTALRPGAFAN